MSGPDTVADPIKARSATSLSVSARGLSDWQ